MDIIERVARSICLVQGLDPEVRVSSASPMYAGRSGMLIVAAVTWPAWHEFIRDAEAAIAAVRQADEMNAQPEQSTNSHASPPQPEA